MARWIGAFVAMLFLLGLGSCPMPVKQISEASSEGYAAPSGSNGYSADGSAQDISGVAPNVTPELGTSPPATDAASAVGSEAPAGAGRGGLWPPGSGQRRDAAGTGDAVGPQSPGADASQQVGPQPGVPGSGVSPYPPQNTTGPQPPQAPVSPGAGQAAQDAVGPTPPVAQYGALDAENFMGDAPVQTVWGQAKPKLSEDALSFSGRWLVAVIHRQGEARMLENGAEWVLELSRDGTFYAKQDRGGQTWRQSGNWELSGMKLLLHSGPGGERSYELSQEMENLCVLRDAAKETALFCVRDDQSAKPAEVQAKYDTDFGLLNLRPAGPGHWRGSYGEPAGTLLLAQLGRFLAGTWEQAPSKGFVLLELREGGFAGAWLYQSSVYFDGRWVGVAVH